MVKAALQTAPAEVASHEVVGGVDGGSSEAVVEWLPAARLFSANLHIDSSHERAFFVWCVFRWEALCFHLFFLN